MKTHNIALAVAALAIAACAKTVEQPEPEGMQITIHAYQEGAFDTKTTVQDGGTQVYWEPNDEIKVFFKGNGSRFISQNADLAAVADFTGTLTIAVGANEGASSSNLTWGLYPYRTDATSDGSSVTTTLPASQTGRAGSFAKNTHICLAAAGGYDLAFYNVTGGIRFSLTQEGIKSVSFQGNNGENLAGKINMAFEGGVPAIKEVSEGETVLTLTAPSGGTFQTGKWYYIEALPGTLSKGFKMVFSKGSESAKLSSSSSVTISRGKYGSLADADEGLIFKPDGGGDDPDPSGVIQFADPIAKYACVEKFDTNGDGEVSYEEAATVTSLEGLFDDWNTVTSFDEIKFFTGVTSIEGVFRGLSKLDHLTIPEFIITFGTSTFQGCSSLKTVVLPSSLSSLPNGCFSDCSALTTISLPSGLTSIPSRCFTGCCSLQTLELPASVTEIGLEAFNSCSSLQTVDLPAGLKTIGWYAFQHCIAISSITFPSSLTSIGECAFHDCTSLTTVAFGNGVSIGSCAFYGCTALASVVLPSDLTSIPIDCFKNCYRLATITWPANLKTINDRAFDGCSFSFASANRTLELPSSVTTIGSSAFGYLHHLIIPSTATVSIQSDSFKAGYTYLYVPAGMVEMYKVRTNWCNYKDQIRPLADYPAELIVGGIPGESVDLGLSTNWASWNVGASAPEEYGSFFAWVKLALSGIIIGLRINGATATLIHSPNTTPIHHTERWITRRFSIRRMMQHTPIGVKIGECRRMQSGRSSLIIVSGHGQIITMALA